MIVSATDSAMVDQPRAVQVSNIQAPVKTPLCYIGVYVHWGVFICGNISVTKKNVTNFYKGKVSMVTFYSILLGEKC